MSVLQGTAEWHEVRRTGIGSSDAPVVAGERGSLLALWAEKTGQAEPVEPDERTAELMAWGHRLEPVIAAVYSETLDRPLRRVRRLLRHRDWPVAFASLDRVSARKGERRVVEIKTRRWWASDAPLPGDWMAQVQHQLWVTAYEVADVAALVGGSELRIIEIPRDDGYLADLEYLERDFWDHVETRTQPPVDGSETARRVLSRLHPADDGQMLPADGAWDEFAIRLRLALLNADQAQAELDTIRNAARAMLGDASGVEGDGWRITWKKSKDSAVTDWMALADSLLPLPADQRQAVIARFTKTQEGPRVLRPWFKEA
jgi:putative phage-type endonuclease